MNVSKDYFEDETLSAIKEQLENTGILRLGQFFEESLCLEFDSKKFKSSVVPNRYSYDVLSGRKPSFSSVNSFLSELLSVKKISVSYDVLKFSQGNYTLLHDLDSFDSFKGVGFLFFTKKFDSTFGGNLVLKDENDSYVIEPVDNTFVYITSEAEFLFFIQYLSSGVSKNFFYAVRFVVS